MHRGELGQTVLPEPHAAIAHAVIAVQHDLGHIDLRALADLEDHIGRAVDALSFDLATAHDVDLGVPIALAQIAFEQALAHALCLEEEQLTAFFEQRPLQQRVLVDRIIAGKARLQIDIHLRHDETQLHSPVHLAELDIGAHFEGIPQRLNAARHHLIIERSAHLHAERGQQLILTVATLALDRDRQHLGQLALLRVQRRSHRLQTQEGDCTA